MSSSKKILFSKSLLDLRQMLDKELVTQSAGKCFDAIHEETKLDVDCIKENTPGISTPTGTCDELTHYKFPLTFNYHGHKWIFYSNAPKDKLLQFHTELEKHKTSIFERYGWRPTLQQRINIDLNACLTGIALNQQNSDMMAMITLFDVSDSKTKKYEFEKELSLCVLPKYQRRHIATDLVRLSWNLFADPNDECWIYVMNSRKSGMFWRKFKQWYPTVRFRLVRP